jgi:hypothetical protein
VFYLLFLIFIVIWPGINEYASDAIYALMKPFELFFLANLYLFELKPEEAINRQYR